MFAVTALACFAPTGPTAADDFDSLASPLGSGDYVDARSFFSEPAEVDAWYALTFALRDDFDDICGDTFCEGDYSNYESLGFRCSVEQSAGVIAECVWIFAASSDEIDPATGQIEVHGETWQCRMPVTRDTPAVDFLQSLTSADERPLHARLPSSERSLYDGLIDCL
jgi:hypothetical protein